MHITASIVNRLHTNEIVVATDGHSRSITIPSKPDGYASAVNGAELLLLSLATCFTNDIYREAKARQIHVTAVEVNASAHFGGPGEPGDGFTYKVKVEADATPAAIDELIRHTDSIAEIHNTLRRGVKVRIQH